MYEDTCASCTHLGEKPNSGKFWCPKKREYRLANTSIDDCHSYCQAYGRSTEKREELLTISKNSGTGCYLTTIMCKLLNYPDNNYYLNTLRYFRDNVMQTNPNYLPLLVLYDVAGPQISKKLEMDPNGKEIAKTFFTNYIVKAVDAVNEGKNQTAITIYTAMTNTLANHYQIIIQNIKVNQNINPTELGHGYTRRRILKEEKRSY